MKNLLRAVVSYFLGLLARAVVRRYHPYIVMVSGSVGKTSTKDAVAAVLGARFFVRKSEKSFNSEFGVPFTILDVSNPWNNPISWALIIKKALSFLLLPNHYPHTLVLEVGSDKPGDLAHILKMVTPNMVVITRLPEISVHVEAYESPDAVREEEFSPAYALAPSAPLIIPADDPYATVAARTTSAERISYGISPEATVRLSESSFDEQEKKVIGMKATITIEEQQGSVLVHGSVGVTQLLPAAAALAAGHALGIPLTESLTALTSYEPPPGRGRLLAGKSDSLIIDDSYNASPAAVEQALHTLKIFPHAKRRIAVLGDMLELGRYSVVEHERIGALARKQADVVVAVGIRARAFATGESGVETLVFPDARSAAEGLLGIIRKGDVVLIKGSQSIRTERIVEALLADPADASRLVRQERAWKRKG